MLNLIRLRHLLPGFAVHGLALLAALSLAGCGASAEAAPPDAPTASPTPWPTLAAVGSAQAVAELRPEETPAPERAGPQLVDQFRAEVLPNAASVFPLEGLAEYPVRVEVIVLTGDLDPVVMISNPAGDQLAYSNTGRLREPEVIGQFIFPADGFYELGVAAAQGTGEVGVSVYRLDPAGLEGGGTFSSMDEELRGTMAHPASYHTFRLPIERGRRFDLSAQALTQGLDLLFELYGPDGALLAARDDNVGTDPYLWNFMPSESGTYTLVVSNYGETVGDYLVRIGPAEGGEPAQIGTRTQLELQGSPRRSSWLTLEGRALNAISVEARPVDPAVDIEIALYDPYGNRLVETNLAGQGVSEQLTLAQFPFDGIYQIEFTTLADSGAIEYLIRPVGAVEIDEGGVVIAGGFGKSGEMRGPGTVFVYQFDATAGDLIGADAHATSSTGLDLVFDLYAPDGQLIASRDDVVGKNPVIDRLELTQSGRYSLALWNYGGTTGTYDIFITRPEAPATPPPQPESGDN